VLLPVFSTPRNFCTDDGDHLDVATAAAWATATMTATTVDDGTEGPGTLTPTTYAQAQQR
jgi:hypothetical protein